MATKKDIESDVKDVISAITRLPKSKLKLGDTLRKTYRLKEIHLGFLALPFTNISREYGGVDVTQAAVKQQKTLGECIDMVHARANTKPKS